MKPERAYYCPNHNDMSGTVTGLKVLVRWVMLIFLSTIGLVGYNIKETQKIQVIVATEISSFAADVREINAKLESMVDEQKSIRADMGDHEERLRALENQ